MPLRVHPGVIGRRLDDCYVLIDGDGEQIYELDATGARPVVDRVLPMDRARDGFAAMAGGEIFGKIVFTR